MCGNAKRLDVISAVRFREAKGPILEPWRKRCNRYRALVYIPSRRVSAPAVMTAKCGHAMREHVNVDVHWVILGGLLACGIAIKEVLVMCRVNGVHGPRRVSAIRGAVLSLEHRGLIDELPDVKIPGCYITIGSVCVAGSKQL